MSVLITKLRSCHHHSSHPSSSENSPLPFLSPWAVPHEMQTPESTFNLDSASNVNLTQAEKEPPNCYLTLPVFAHDLHCKIFCLAVVHILPLSYDSGPLVTFPVCSLGLCPHCLFLVVLGTNLIISQVPGKETSLSLGLSPPAKGNQSKCPF